MMNNSGSGMTSSGPLWTPSAERIEASTMRAYMGWLAKERGLDFRDYDEMYRWSVTDLPAFWSSIWDYFKVVGRRDDNEVLSGEVMPGMHWFPGAHLNYAEHALRAAPDSIAIIARSETRAEVTMTYGELAAAVGAARVGLKRLGVQSGDRVVSYMPNVPETLIAFLACASIGALWSTCAPEFGVGSVIDRFAQIQPKVMLTIDGYVHGGRTYERIGTVAEIASRLSGLEHVVVLPYLQDHPELRGLPGPLLWAELVAESGHPAFEEVDFEHPLWVLYSSGTTGMPKAIVHGHGGILLEHLKALALHCDIGPGDRFFWQTTTGWMMWNFLAGGLLRGATVIAYDGSPGYPDMNVLWGLVAETRTTFFGTSAAFIQACVKEDQHPSRDHDLTALRSVGSTGSPLSPEGFRWMYQQVGKDLLLGSISGGTDVCTAFVGGCPLLPVWESEIQCRMLGVAVESFDEAGRPRIGEVGELVVTKPIPSMPLFFWGDHAGERLRDSYFSMYPGIWRHGDWVRFTPRGGCVIVGRSDSTLNRNGVRMGTAEFYRVVEALPEVLDSLVVDTTGDGHEGRLLLFVILEPGKELDEHLQARITRAIREELSPWHVPDEMHRVMEVPRTLTGKKMEIPVKRILSGAEVETVASSDAMQNPDALRPFVALRRAT